jgi:O-6-methylguanine DNA methyltransferase
MKDGFFNDVYNAVKSIPKGFVATYGDIAKMTGRPNMARFVGFALHSNPSPNEIPCYKIVDRNGNLAKAFVFGGINAQKNLLEKEGIKVIDNKIDLKKYRIKFI